MKRSTVLACVALGCAATVLLLQRKRQRVVRRDPADIVDETSIESFPASDPPSWTSAALSTK